MHYNLNHVHLIDTNADKDSNTNSNYQLRKPEELRGKRMIAIADYTVVASTTIFTSPTANEKEAGQR